MLTIIITAAREPATIGRAIEAFLQQELGQYELLVVCPDRETADAIQPYMHKNRRISVLRDPGRGKPAALNLAFQQAKGDIIILSDGDVHVAEGAVSALLAKFKNDVGAVCGRPVSTNDRSTMLGYWSHLLTDAGAHWRRMQGDFIECSGYLYAIRNVVKRIPADVLADDAYISHVIAERGYRIAYAPAAQVYVKYPTTFADWIAQKRRSAGGYLHIRKRFGAEIGRAHV